MDEINVIKRKETYNDHNFNLLDSSECHISLLVQGGVQRKETSKDPTNQDIR